MWSMIRENEWYLNLAEREFMMITSLKASRRLVKYIKISTSDVGVCFFSKFTFLTVS